jgi:hypothetical protein
MSQFFGHLGMSGCVGTMRSWDVTIISRQYCPTFIVPSLVGYLEGSVERCRLANSSHYDRLSNAYNCPYCTQAFGEVRMLDEHLSLQYHDVKAYFCPNEGCDTRFTTFSGLCNHVETSSPCREDTKNGKQSMAGLRACLVDLGGTLLF